MTNRYFRYGQLNPVVHPNRGRTLDPTATSGIESLSRLAKADTTPRFLDKMRGPLRGIVIEIIDASEPSLFDLISEKFLGSSDEKGNFRRGIDKYRVRIPELHAHLPEPLYYGEQGIENNYSILKMYPVFEAMNPDAKKAQVGSIVYVDFLDRERFLQPIYIGPLDNQPSQDNAGADQNTESALSVGARAGSSGNLAVNQPSGENQAPTVSSYGQEMSLVSDSNLNSQSQETKIATNAPRSYSESIRQSRDTSVLPARNPNGYHLPVDEPAEVISWYGQKREVGSSPHRGVDLRATPRVGGPIYAIDDGTVIRVVSNDPDAGNWILISHGMKNGKKHWSQYLHFSAHRMRNGRKFRYGDKVKAGEIIGYAGATGKVTGPHLHLDVFVNEKRVNPGPYVEAARNKSRNLVSSR